MLQDTIERMFARNLYADVTRGLFLVRGENVLLMGEIVSLLSFQSLRNMQAQAGTFYSCLKCAAGLGQG